MSKEVEKNTESKAIITPEQLIAENANLLPALTKNEEKAGKLAEQGRKLVKDIIRIVGDIDAKGLYKAKGYTTANQYLEAGQLAGVSSSTCSQYLNVARRFMLSDNAERKAMFERMDYTTLAELVTFSDEALTAFCAEHGIKALADMTSENIVKEEVRDFKKSHDVAGDGKPKTRIVKHYDYSGIVSKPAEGAQWYPFTLNDIDEDFFTESNSINRATLAKVGKLENGLKDSFAFTALNVDMTSIYYFTRVPHVTKAENDLASTKEARAASIEAYLAELTPEERAAFIAKITG